MGLPDPRKDHAVIMARFARDCLQTVNDLTKKLEVTLGPDTGKRHRAAEMFKVALSYVSHRTAFTTHF